MADCRRVACIALTFDDGPNAKTTAQILDTLEREHVAATFFVIGSRVAPNAQLIQRMHRDGFEIGNHSWTHPNLTAMKPKQIRAQIKQTQTAIERAGAPAPTLFRPPYGYSDSKMHRNISLTFMFWNEDPRDWEAHSAKQVVRAVETAARPGGVVDMHDIYKVTADALPHIIHNLKARQYHFVTVSQLLDLHPGQKGEFYGRVPPKGHVP
jgi:peptidoglycan/xylan/chitin deacetylase (PgdA/CDA1 family)